MAKKRRRFEMEQMGLQVLAQMVKGVVLVGVLGLLGLGLGGQLGGLLKGVLRWLGLSEWMTLGVLAPVIVVLGLGLLGIVVSYLRQWQWQWSELKVIQLKASLTFKAKSKGEDWTITLGWIIPRKYRHVIGDILEDCAEMREAGCTERRIKFHVVYQWLIAVITLVPTAVKTSIADILKHVISPPK